MQKKGLKLANFKNVFLIQVANHSMDKRASNKYKVNSAKTERYFRSTIPYMQRKLNNYEKDLKIIIVLVLVPTNFTLVVLSLWNFNVKKI